MDDGGTRTQNHQDIMYENLEKGPAAGGSRFAWLRTKRAIAGFAVLGCAIIAIIALLVTGTIGGSGSSQKSNSVASGTGASSESSTASLAFATAASTTQLSATASAKPTKSTASSSSSTSSKTSASRASSTSSDLKPSGTIANGTPLRIMPMGASCVKGEESPGNVGFRKELRNQLTSLNAPVNMVGAVQLGDMVDNDLEAYGGIKITQLHNYAKKSVPDMQPNVFVINIGTNNALQYVEIDKVGSQMEDLIDYLLEASPKSVVVMSTLLTNTVSGCEPLILDMNQQFRDLYSKYEEEGKPVVLAEMHPSEGDPDRPEAGDIGSDGTHPTPEGYSKMATIFTQAIQEADQKGFIQKPVDNGIPDDGAAGKSKSTSSTKKRRAVPPKRDHPLIIPRWCGA